MWITVFVWQHLFVMSVYQLFSWSGASVCLITPKRVNKNRQNWNLPIYLPVRFIFKKQKQNVNIWSVTYLSPTVKWVSNELMKMLLFQLTSPFTWHDYHSRSSSSSKSRILIWKIESSHTRTTQKKIKAISHEWVIFAGNTKSLCLLDKYKIKRII